MLNCRIVVSEPRFNQQIKHPLYNRRQFTFYNSDCELAMPFPPDSFIERLNFAGDSIEHFLSGLNQGRKLGNLLS